MHARTLARLLQAAVLTAAPAGCLFNTSTSCNTPARTETFDLSDPDAGVGDAGTGSCEDFCSRKTQQYVVACKFVTLSGDGGPSRPGVECTTKAYCEGRLPETLLDEPPARTNVGEHFAGAAFLEAASVESFRVLASELRALGAPRRLVKAARRARRDEVRHARSMRALARRHGQRCIPPRVGARRTRDLEEIALENAVEGCVRETYGAALAWFQATHAADLEVRDAMTKIARDETRHAALAWEVHRWARARLSPAARARVDAAHQAALRELARDVASSRAEATLGTPGGSEASALVARLRETLWA